MSHADVQLLSERKSLEERDSEICWILSSYLSTSKPCKSLGAFKSLLAALGR